MRFTLSISSDTTFQCHTSCVNVAGITDRDDASGYCNTPAFPACLTAYFQVAQEEQGPLYHRSDLIFLEGAGFCIYIEAMCSTLAEFSSNS